MPAAATSAAHPLSVGVIDTDSGFIQVLVKRMDDLDWRHRVSAGPVSVDALVATRLDALVVDPAVLGHQAWAYLELVCERLPSLAVVVCTGRSSVAQRVRGLRMGADDWMTKPCHPEELLARLEAVVRRRRVAEIPAGGGAAVISAGELEVRLDQFQAFVDRRSVELTRREFELIHLLASVPGQVLQREDIYQRVWGYAMAHGDRSVDVFVRKLRQKLEKASPSWRYIHTHFGVGYRFDAEPVDGSDPADDDVPAAPAPAAPRVPVAA
jgi:DNA-binding response OmpR family regulator